MRSPCSSAHRLHAHAAHTDRRPTGSMDILESTAIFALSRIARNRPDFNDAVVDFRNFLRDIGHELRMRARKEIWDPAFSRRTS